MSPAGISFKRNFDFDEFVANYATTGPLEGHPELQDDCWTWRRRLETGPYEGKIILCCPEDERCAAAHSNQMWCKDCRVPICRNCISTSLKNSENTNGIPMCLANDNFTGFATELLYLYWVRWIELAVASPVFTCMIVYYIEGDRGHLLEERVGEATHATVVRGNAYSFHMPWEQLLRKLNQACDDLTCGTLPHEEEALAQMVQYNLRIGDLTELNEFVPQAKLRPFVVKKLLEHLIDRRHPALVGEHKNLHGEALRAHVCRLVDERYPEQEASLPEGQRQGTIPPAVEYIMRQAQERPVDSRRSPFVLKNATPQAAVVKHVPTQIILNLCVHHMGLSMSNV